MNIYIPIEVKARELEGRGLLAIAAAERGHNVILGEKRDTLSLAMKGYLAPGIIHEKSLTPSDAKIQVMAGLNEQGHVITSQDEEHGLLDETYDQFANRRYSEETVSRAAGIFTWGAHDEAALNAHYKEYSGRIKPTGSPRADFWRKDFSDYFRNHEVNEENRQKPYVLIASNFHTFTNENLLWNQLARLREAGYFDRDPGMESHIYENTAYQLHLAFEFIKMIRSLVSTFPEVDFIFRPHPTEAMDAWGKMIGDFPNLYVKRTGTISGWLRNSSMLLHNGCTSAIEAAVFGLPRIAYRPIPSEFERDMPNRISYPAFNMEELQERVTAILDGRRMEGMEEVEQRTREFLESRFANLKGELAADRMVDEWEKIGKSAGLEDVPISDLFTGGSKRLYDLKKDIKRKLVTVRNTVSPSYSSGGQQGKLLNTTHKFPSLETEEVHQLLNNLRKTLDRFHDVTFQRFGKKSFIIYRE